MEYDILMIDPPWPKKKGGIRNVRPNQDRMLDYDTMHEHDVFSLLKNTILPYNQEFQHTVFLWCIDTFLVFSETTMQDIGYKRHARLIWDKGNGVAPCFSVRYSHEYLIWFYKPKFMPISQETRGKYTTVFREAPREHSRKPDFAYEMIDKMYPESSKIDIFSREKRAGWDQWGNETGYFKDEQV